MVMGKADSAHRHNFAMTQNMTPVITKQIPK